MGVVGVCGGGGVRFMRSVRMLCSCWRWCGWRDVVLVMRLVGGGGVINRGYVWLAGCRVSGVVDSGGV